MKVVVIGAGAAGTAAAWKAARDGCRVTVVHAGPGTTAIYSGAWDLCPWDTAPEREPIAPDALAFAAALGGVALGPEAALVVSEAGVLRRARGHDAGLLDLRPLAGKRVAVAEVPLLGWDARGFCRSLAESEWAQKTSTRFEPTRVGLFERAAERRLNDFDAASLFDDDARAQELVGVLRRAGDPDAWLVGPWLGTVARTAQLVRALLGRPVGEAMASPGGPAGARFESSRDELFGMLDIVPVGARAEKVEPSARGWSVQTSAKSYLADAVILASGGVAGGGVVLSRPSEGGHPSGFGLSVAAPAALELDGRLVIGASSLYGVLPSGGLGILDRIGVRADGPRVIGSPRLYAAGDLVAGRPRTMFHAITSGIEAARSAVEDWQH